MRQKNILLLLPWWFLLFFILSTSQILTAQEQDWLRTNGPEGGLVSAITRRPDGRLLAGLSGGGMYISPDNGATWSPTGPSYLGVNQFAHTADGDVFVATHDGVFRLQPNAMNWNWVGLYNVNTSSLIVESDSSLLAGTSTAGVRRSTDKGKTWSLVGLADKHIAGMVRDKYGQLFATNGIGDIYMSSNNGTTWKTMETNMPTNVLVATPEGYLLAGVSGGIYRSFMSGSNWSKVTFPFTSVTCFSVTPRGEIVAGTGQGVYVLVRSGEMYGFLGLGTRGVRSILADSLTSIFAGTDGAGIYRSTNSGAVWAGLIVGFPGSNVRSVAATRSGALFAGTWKNGLWKSTDKGTRWSRAGFDDNLVYKLFVSKQGALYAASDSGLHRQTNPDRPWEQLSTNTFIQDILVCDDGTMLLGTVFDGILRSSDDGVTWTKPQGIHMTDRIDALVALDDRVMLAGSPISGIHRSEDAGETWSPSGNGLPTNKIQALAVGGPGIVLAGVTWGGVAKSTDSGHTWREANSGFPLHHQMGQVPTPLSFLELPNQEIVVALHGSGIYRSIDKGESWILFGKGLAAAVRSLAYTVDGYVIVGTEGAGVQISSRPLGVVSVDPPENPAAFSLNQNFPNPFNPRTTITFSLTVDGWVDLRLFDLLGREAMVLMSGHRMKGLHTVHLDADGLQNGVYFYRLVSGSFQSTRKLAVVK